MTTATAMLATLLVAACLGAGCDGERSRGKEPEMTAEAAAPHTEIRWLEWSDEVFARAAAENKLILLDSGATWCHWCHVMDRVTYEDPDVITLVNERFIPVRIDRDRLPDVDARLQREPALIAPMGEAGGWPLTVLLTPEGHVLMKVTFLPPRGDAYGLSIGLIDVLEKVDDHWRRHEKDIAAAAGRLQQEMAQRHEEVHSRPGQLRPQQLDELLAGLSQAYDETHGGFGTAPKFFTVGGLELLAVRSWASEERTRRMLLGTLEGMARGGVYDQVGGGFHRYSVDERWHVPHFEKMGSDNAALLAIYADAAALTGREDLAAAARHILAWIDEVLSEPNGGFYASQDADVGLDDDGDYFTWTVGEIRDALGGRADLILSYYGADEAGDVHGRVGRNVLHVTKTPEQLARLLERDVEQVAQEIAAARADLLAARRKRTAPAVDKTIYADINGMMIHAHLAAWQRLGEQAARDKALAALQAVMASLRDERGVFAHWRAEDGTLQRVGLLDDQAWMARALLDAYAATGKADCLAAARTLGDYILENLAAGDGGLLSAPQAAATQPADVPGRRSWEDSPGRSAASVAAQALTDLAHLTGDAKYTAAARRAMESFAGGVGRDAAQFYGGYGVAAEYLLYGPRSVVVVGPSGDAATQDLAKAARSSYLPGGLVFVADPADAGGKELLEHLRYPAGERPAAYVCRGGTCLAPAYSPQELRQRIEELARTQSSGPAMVGRR